jgi:comEA protein
MQRLEKAISIIIFSGLIACITISYSLKANQAIIPVAKAESDEIISAQKNIGQSKIININTANRYLLTKLPGIGPKLAERVVEYRDAHGLFTSCEDIMKVKGIGQKKYQIISGMITVND